MSIIEKLDKYLGEAKKLSKGDKIWVRPLTKGEKKDYPEAAWVNKMQKVALAEDASMKFPASKVKVKDKMGNEREIYIFQIDTI